ncbi:unnamed protein product [Effrenium voratum]|nr:unnamed protein product [Effrenium voratum]
MATITRKQVTLAALALAVTLKATLGFAGGVVRAGLRGAEPSAGKAASAQPSAFEGLLPAAGALAVGASAIALRRSSASSSKGWSPVALRATRVEWFRKVRRIRCGDRAVFDVTVKKPMGLVLEYLPDKKGGMRGVGVSEIVKDGNGYELNRKVCVTEEDEGMWILEGDRIIAVNGIETVDASIEDIARLVGESPDDSVVLTLCRNTRLGPIKVVVLPEGEFATVRRNSRLSSAVEFAKGKEHQVWLHRWLVRNLLAPRACHRLALQAVLRPHHHGLGQRDADGALPQAGKGRRRHAPLTPRAMRECLTEQRNCTRASRFSEAWRV